MALVEGAIAISRVWRADDAWREAENNFDKALQNAVEKQAGGR